MFIFEKSFKFFIMVSTSSNRFLFHKLLVRTRHRVPRRRTSKDLQCSSCYIRGPSVTCEVQQLLGNNKVRAVSMTSTDGLKRGASVTDTESPIMFL